MIIPDELVHELIGKEQSISFCLWKQLPDHAVQILEEAGYTKYDRKTDSICTTNSSSIPKNERLC